MQDDFLEFFYRALREDIGVSVVITEGSMKLATQKAFNQRKAACDPALDNIQISQSPTNPNALWFVKKGPA